MNQSMQQLKKIGQIKPKSSKEIKHSQIGLGFEKLDRDVFDPEKAYDKVAETGIKWARIQSGWQRTEREKGVYKFEWIDSIVDNLIERGIEPWVCLCYGNDLYNEEAKEIFGAVGCAPIFNDEQKQGWANYVKAFTEHFKGRINYYEVWNEPDGRWCWKHGPSGKELGEFTIATAKAVKEVYPEAKVIGGCVCQRRLDFLNDAFLTGMGDYIDYVTFHEYVRDETLVFEKVKTFQSLINKYNPNIGLIQGESGSQSRSGGHGALRTAGWTEVAQAKQLARHTIADIMSGVLFTSYFSCMDMIEALNGIVGDKASYLDYGYFGILGADFDEDGHSSGEYYRKPSFYALQNIASVFADDYEQCELPIFFHPMPSEWVMGSDIERNQAITGCFKRKNGEAMVYWYPTNILTTSYEGTIRLEVLTDHGKDMKIVDVMDGSIYEIPDELIEEVGNGVYNIQKLPIKDTPLLITFGDFLEEEK